MSTDLQPEQKSEAKEGLPKFLRFSIFALVAVTLITIVALFVDNIEGKGIKITLTFVIFAMFVGLAALDTLKGSKRSWYAPAAFLSNTVFLGASILTVWLTPGIYFGFTAVAVFHILVYLAILRAGLFFGMLAMNAIDREEDGGRKLELYENKSSLWAAWLGGIAAALFVVYIAANQILTGRTINYSLFGFWDIYLKLSTAVLILAGLALSISFLLRWFFGADERASKRASLAGQAHLHSDWEAQNRGGYGQNQWPAPQNQMPTWPAPGAGDQMPAWPAPKAVTPVATQQDQGLLPWPTFDDGRPFPAGADGQPDFEAAKREASPEPQTPQSGKLEDGSDEPWWVKEARETQAEEAKAQGEPQDAPMAPQPPQAPSAPSAPAEPHGHGWIAPTPRSSDGWNRPEDAQGWRR